MEKINTEILVSSLFTIGFDKVDALLFTYILGQLSIDNRKLQLFEYEETEISKKFNEFVDYDGVTFKLKDDITLDTNVSPTENHTCPLVKALHTNKKLVEYLSKLDFRKIIIKKIETLNSDKIDSFDILFSNKEKEIMYKMFGIENIHKEETIRQSQIYSELYDQETRDIDGMLNGILIRKK